MAYTWSGLSFSSASITWDGVKEGEEGRKGREEKGRRRGEREGV